jgi:hypothetical protein
MKEYVRLKPLKYKQRKLIQDHGEVWVERQRMNVAAFGGQLGVKIVSQVDGHIRWVRATEVEKL